MKHNPPALRFVLLALLLFWLPLWGANCTAGGQVDGPSSPEQTLVIVDGATTPDDLVLPEHTQGKDGPSGHKERNCDPVDCVSPPAATCLPSGKRRAYEPNGSCHPIDDKCVYQVIEEDCQGVCHKGQCFAKGDPCTSITCDTPPAPKCVGEKTLQTYAASGTCQNQTCTYQSTTQPCAYGCQSGKCQPPPTDPCTGVRCNTPPASKCIDSNTLRNYYPTGQCQQGTCRYSHSDQTCPHGCTQNTCKLGTGFSAISPFRALDTRSNSLPGKESTRCFVVTGKGNVAPSARAVYINLVSVSSTSPGFLTAYPKGAKLPNVSTLNYTTGQAIANGAIIKVGTGGQICVYTKAPTHIIVDLYGFFDADADFFPTGPYRRLDTRQSTKRKATSTQCYAIAGQNGIPTSAKAVFANFAAVSPSAVGHLIAYPKGDPTPKSSNLNHTAGQTIAGGSIVELGDNGEICVYTHAELDLIIDIYGYFGQSSSFIPLGPKRVLDTRNTSKVPAKSTRCYSLTGAHGIPQQIKAIAFNATALAADGPGFLQVYTEGLARPVTSTINYQANTAIANNALVQPGTTGKICVYNLTSAHYILDVVGYWLRNQTGDPCAGITCNNPPTPICTGTQVIASYAAKGSCKGGICVYTPSIKTCAYKCENAKCIPKPATPPPTTPTFQYHPVTSWQTSQDPVRSGSYMDLKALRYITIHYNGGNLDLDGPDNVYQDADMAQILRNTQRDYVVNRGYSLGYNSAVAPDGDEWEIRGLRYRAASNGCTKVNRPAYTIFVPLPSVSAKPTTAQVQGINAVIARIRAAAKAAGNPNHLTINGHRDVRPQCGGGTACPGVQLYQMIQNGTIGPK